MVNLLCKIKSSNDATWPLVLSVPIRCYPVLRYFPCESGEIAPGVKSI